MKLLARHTILVTGMSYGDCKAQILGFFKKTSLVQYDKITIDDTTVVNGEDDRFPAQLKTGLEQNNAILAKLIEELKATGFDKHSDLVNLKQGYPSKVLHIIAHFLDGFIGIDTIFYNLIDDSHWVSPVIEEQITNVPGQFWLVSLDCYSMTPREAALLHM